MSTKIDKKYQPDSEYRFFFFDSEGNGFEYFKTIELRDECANQAIQEYLDDCWDEQVENIFVGEVTGEATKVDVEMRPESLDEDGCDEEGVYWEQEWDYKCNYKICPLKVKDK